MNSHTEEIHTLQETLIYELTKALALPQKAWAKNIVRAVFGKATQAAAEVGIGLDCICVEGRRWRGGNGAADCRDEPRACDG